ncbi:MAG TPA: hypothetical protein PLY81_10420 [Chitinophagaceae bacterium]|nr:hypothetical protein [Chitinophagaceae bacterium]
MKILLKKVLIVDKESIFNNTINDILIENGIIKTINENITETAEIVFQEKNCILVKNYS